MRKVLIASIAAALLLPVTGCHKQTTVSTPPTAAAIYANSATFMVDFATDLEQIQQIEISLHKGGAITDAVHSDIQGYFSQIAGYGLQIDALLKGNASASTIQAKIDQAATALAGMAISTGKIDPSTAAQLNAAVAAMQLLMANLTKQLSGLPAVS
jgi:LDH2 family malate/lactate/ureidoglycolate dehydrogenase